LHGVEGRELVRGRQVRDVVLLAAGAHGDSVYVGLFLACGSAIGSQSQPYKLLFSVESAL
jgi:hypothetical protein